MPKSGTRSTYAWWVFFMYFEAASWQTVVRVGRRSPQCGHRFSGCKSPAGGWGPKQGQMVVGRHCACLQNWQFWIECGMYISAMSCHTAHMLVAVVWDKRLLGCVTKRGQLAVVMHTALAFCCMSTSYAVHTRLTCLWLVCGAKCGLSVTKRGRMVVGRHTGMIVA
jgi:hypothetical protein